MAQTPPPYVDITGIMTNDDKHQSVTLVEYDGNARPGQLVVDLATYTLWIGNAQGNVNPVGGGGGNGTPGGFNTYVQFNNAGNFGGSANLTYNSGTSLLTIGGTANVTNLNVGVVGTDLIPSSNVTYSLGNSTNQWKDLWVSNNTIYINSVPVSIGAANNLQVAGSNVVTAAANGQTNTAQLDVTGNITGGNVIGGNITANYFIGNGSLLTGLPASYSNANVAAYLPTYSGNVTANYFIGDGSQLTNLPSGSSYSNANVASYLPIYTGNLASLTGNVTTTANISAGYFIGNGSQLTGLPASYSNANVAAYLPTYSGNVSANYFIGNGSTLSSITGANVIGTVANATNSVNALAALSANTAVYANLVMDAAQPNITSVGTLSTLNVAGNATANYFIGNGSQLTGIVSSYGNSNVTALLANTSIPISTTSNVTAANVNATNVNVANTVTASLFIGNFQGNISGNLVVPGSNTQVLFNNQGNAGADAGFTFNAATKNVSIANTLTVGNVTTSGNIVSSSLSVGANNITISNNTISTNAQTITIDPLSDGGPAGNVVIQGNLQVTGNLTYVDVTTATTGNLLWQSANNASNASQANGGGLAVGPSGNSYATWTYGTTANSWISNLPIVATGGANINGPLSGATTGAFSNTVTASGFVGSGAALSNLSASNVVGQVGNALVAGTVYTNAQPNITSVGTLTALSVSGNANVGQINATGDITTTGNLTANNINATTQTISGNASATYFIGDGSLLSNISASNISGSFGNVIANNIGGNGYGLFGINGSNIVSTVANATFALTAQNAANAANATYATTAGSANVASVASVVTGNAQPNITSVGTLTTLTVGGNVSANYFVGNGSTLSSITGSNVVGAVANATFADSAGNATFATSAGNVTTNAQPNITSVGTLTSLTVSGNTTAAYFIGDGSQLTNLPLGGYSNSNVTAYLSSGTDTAGYTTGGDVAANNIVGGNVSSTNNGLFGGNVTALGNVTASYFIGNGSQLTGLPASYSDANVANYLPTYTGNLVSLTGNVTTTANISGAYILGNGSQLTGLPASYSNANVASYLPTYTGNLASLTGNVTTTATISAAYLIGDGSQLSNLNLGNATGGYGNANVASYLPTYTGNLVSLTGNVTTIANISGAYILGNGSQLTGLPVGYSNAAVSAYLASGNDVAGYATAGDIAGNNIVASSGLSSLGDAYYAANVTVVGDLSAANFIGNGSQLTGMYGNADVSTYLASGDNTAGFGTAGNITADVIFANTSIETSIANAGTINSGTIYAYRVNLLNNLTANGNVTASYFIGDGSQLTGMYGNANVATYLANNTGNIGNATVTGETNLNDIGNITITGGASGQAIITDGTGNLSFGNVITTVIPAIYFTAPSAGNNQTFSNTYLASYGANTDVTLFYNGALLENTYYDLSGDTLTINTPLNVGDSIDVMQQFSGNLNIIENNPYGNANVASYLPTYGGNVTANSVSADTIETSGNVTVGSWGGVPQWWFNGTLSTNQSLTANADTVINWNTNYDPMTWWNGTTHRVTPTQPGWYEVTSRILFVQNSGGNSQGQLNHQIRMNGATHCLSQQQASNQNNGQTLVATAFINMNGTTDYLDFSAYTSQTGESVGGQANGALSQVYLRWVSY
jgi:hypothetical protein